MDLGIKFTELRQGFLSLSSPTKELEKMITAGEMEFFNDPVMRWMISNCMILRDPAGNIKLTKDTGVLKIDAVAAMVNSIAEWMTPIEEADSTIEVW